MPNLEKQSKDIYRNMGKMPVAADVLIVFRQIAATGGLTGMVNLIAGNWNTKTNIII